MRRFTAVCVLILMSIAVMAEKKPLEWQNGTLTDISIKKGSRLVGANDVGYGALRDDATYYTINTAEYSYIVKRRLTKPNDEQLTLTVNRPVKFAVMTDKVLLLDENGKEHKLTLEKKTPKKQTSGK